MLAARVTLMVGGEPAGQGLVKAEWTTTENRRRARLYTLTAAGRKRLEEAEESWTAVAKGVSRLLRYV